MPTDRQIVDITEAFIPPKLICHFIECQLGIAGISDDARKKKIAQLDRPYKQWIKDLDSAVSSILNINPFIKSAVLVNFNEFTKKANHHFRSKNIDCRKALILVTEWAIAIYANKPAHAGFIKTLEELRWVFEHQPEKIEGWDDIEKDALQAALEFHQFMQGNEYYKSA